MNKNLNWRYLFYIFIVINIILFAIWKFHTKLTHPFHSKLTQVFHFILTHLFHCKLTQVFHSILTHLFRFAVLRITAS
jgi:hypothetical protein